MFATRGFFPFGLSLPLYCDGLTHRSTGTPFSSICTGKSMPHSSRTWFGGATGMSIVSVIAGPTSVPSGKQVQPEVNHEVVLERGAERHCRGELHRYLALYPWYALWLWKWP